MIQFDKKAIQEFSQNYRRNFCNSLTGIKPAHLLGSINSLGITNLSLFSSAVHLGADPALIGVIFRPLTVARHSYTNLKETGFYTLNSISEALHLAAHQASAPYPEDISEFEATGLIPEFSTLHPAPYVQGAPIQIGLSYVEEYLIQANGTILVVGAVEEVRMQESWIAEDGYIDTARTQSMGIGGLDGYYTVQKTGRYQYAKVERPFVKID